ncbi:biotin transporter BioY [Nesterenkonia populi]
MPDEHRSNIGAPPRDGEAAPVRRARAANPATDAALVGVFAALIAVLTFAPPIPVGNAGVPITLQTLGVALAGLTLGPWRGAAAAGLYAALGLLGLPILAGFTGGLGALAGPSAGYLLSFPVTALVTGLIARGVLRRTSAGWWVPLLFVAAAAGSVLVNHPMGIVGMMINMELSFGEAFLADIVFWPGDLAKSLVGAAAAALIHRAFPDLLVRRR